MTILDIGSGTVSKYHAYLKGDNVIHVDINRSAFHLEVLCDIQYLPFKNKCFKIIHVSHILEHVNNPIKALRELKTVFNSVIIIKVPNASHYKYYEESHEHIYSWNISTLNNLLKRFFSEVTITQSKRLIEVSAYPKLKRILSYFKWYFWHHLNPYNELIAVCKK